MLNCHLANILKSLIPGLLLYFVWHLFFKWRIYDWAIFSKTHKFKAKLWSRTKYPRTKSLKNPQTSSLIAMIYYGTLKWSADFQGVFILGNSVPILTKVRGKFVFMIGYITLIFFIRKCFIRNQGWEWSKIKKKIRKLPSLTYSVIKNK